MSCRRRLVVVPTSGFPAIRRRVQAGWIEGHDNEDGMIVGRGIQRTVVTEAGQSVVAQMWIVNSHQPSVVCPEGQVWRDGPGSHLWPSAARALGQATVAWALCTLFGPRIGNEQSRRIL